MAKYQKPHRFQFKAERTRSGALQVSLLSRDIEGAITNNGDHTMTVRAAANQVRTDAKEAVRLYFAPVKAIIQEFRRSVSRPVGTAHAHYKARPQRDDP